MKLKTVTLGCKVNQYETEYVREGLLKLGYQDIDSDDCVAEEESSEGTECGKSDTRDDSARPSADLCIVNTCTVTAEGDSKSRQIIRRLARDNPTSKIVVMGCYATRAPTEVAGLPNVTEVVTDKRELPDLLGRFGVTDVPTGISGFGRRHRAYVKVQDGCLLRCSFCIIPHVRPQLESRPMEHILEEIRRLVARGYREIVLTGIHLGHYGIEWNRNREKSQWTRLSHLLQAITTIPGDFRVRLSSMEATEVTRELVEVMAEFPKKICPHLHISMQSGSDRVLRRMRRRWGSQRFIDRCGLIKERLEQPAITTDIMVGFPGETDQEFAETCDVARQVGFSKIHIFPFSPRRGTPAADMPDQISKQIKSERRKELARLEEELRDSYFTSLSGKKLRVLVESTLGKTSDLIGTACRYSPVVLPEGTSHRGELVEVLAGPVSHGRIQGILI